MYSIRVPARYNSNVDKGVKKLDNVLRRRHIHGIGRSKGGEKVAYIFSIFRIRFIPNNMQFDPRNGAQARLPH